MSLDELTLDKKVAEYFARNDVKHYDENKVSFWMFISGNDEEGRRRPFDVVYGSYKDAVAHLVQDSQYFGWWCGTIRNQNCGKVEPCEPKFLVSSVQNCSLSEVMSIVKK